uniref:Uncharacterized protein n=1 Tax=Picea glauca TaxID=3330 RepID=A0A101LX00_PICGL|nr:hypothetical protein ABT39_MTgene6372 [Picea glauca]QHR86306.1 hypothetical protein Q903MT_gene305 [Picea sitchensis]
MIFNVKFIPNNPKDSILNRDMEEDMLHQIGVVPVPYDDLNDPVVSLLTY